MTTLTFPASGPCRAESDLWRLPPDGRAAFVLRERVVAQLRGWHLAELGPDLALIASELAGNAVRYGRPPIWANLQVMTGPGHRESVRLVVADFGPGFAVDEIVRSWPLSGTSRSEHGRGLLLVDALAGDWGSEVRPPLSLTWADLPAVG
ncbi:ATP-binding protein [Kitasatospora sp. NPDC057223]|uniref:ATP-binding protein n=1 Tax=Kitasatospora sp. NPDC057223 TaxID=3346055 RepID=UPI00364096C0